MKVTTARLYHPAPWGWLYSYQAALLSLRVLEHCVIIFRYLFLRAPLLLAWTRLPGLRDRQPPLWRDLARVLAPIQTRASLSLGAGQLGTELGDAQSVGDASSLIDGFLAETKPPSRFWK